MNRHDGSGGVVVTFTGDLTQLKQAKQDAKQIVRDATREMQQEVRQATSAIGSAGAVSISQASDLIAGGATVAGNANAILTKARNRAARRQQNMMERNAARFMAGDEAVDLFGVDADERSFRRFLSDERKERAAGVRRAGRYVRGGPPTLDAISELMPQPEVQQGLALRPGASAFDPSFGEGVVGSIAGRLGISSGTALGAGLAYAGWRGIGSISRAGTDSMRASHEFGMSFMGATGDSTPGALAGFVGNNAFKGGGPWGAAGNALTFGRFGYELEKATEAARGLASAHHSATAASASLNASLAAISGNPIAGSKFSGDEMIRLADIEYRKARSNASTVRGSSRRGTPAYRAADNIQDEAAAVYNMTVDFADAQSARTRRQYAAGVLGIHAAGASAMIDRRGANAAIGGDPMGAFLAEQQGSYIDMLAGFKNQLAGVAPGSMEEQTLRGTQAMQESAFRARGRLSLRNFIGNAPQGLSFTNTLDAIGEGKVNALMGGYADKAEQDWANKLLQAAAYLEGAAKSLDARIQAKDASQN